VGGRGLCLGAGKKLEASLPKVVLGRAAERRPTGKMLRRRKMLGIAPESPASGACFVGLFLFCKTPCLSKTTQSRLRISVIK